MAVLVDRSFFNALGKMDDVKDISNCDIAWFVIRYEESGGEALLTLTKYVLQLWNERWKGLQAATQLVLKCLKPESGKSLLRHSRVAKPIEIPAHQQLRHLCVVSVLHRNTVGIKTKL